MPSNAGHSLFRKRGGRGKQSRDEVEYRIVAYRPNGIEYQKGGPFESRSEAQQAANDLRAKVRNENGWTPRIDLHIRTEFASDGGRDPSEKVERDI